ncbi:hypothetical protein BGZ97_001175 [Linnemannia gamsii]|uniref:Uncharacterized protein n=1 Tax=Linnemannia gamsii TaxID=64522 RepID=A0A9P6R0Y1_9FUNG|nr:hypothetical protein BGZ97_001175 [Linnemannia gamsii]
MSVLLARLRIGIAALLLLVIILNAAFWILSFNSIPSNSIAQRTLLTPERLIIADHVLLFLIFVYAAVPRLPTKVPRYARAFVLFVLAVYMLYYHLDFLSSLFQSKVFICKSSTIQNACGIHRVVQLFGSVAGFLIMYENALTLKETDPNPPTKAAEIQATATGGGEGGQQVPYHLAMQTPLPMQQIHPQQQQFQQQGVYYPQQQQPFVLAQQQPLQNPTQKFEAPEQQQQQFQPQPLYQLSPQQQQQQQQFYQPLQPGQQPLHQQNPYLQQQTVAAQPMVPGSLVTTTPQPGGQAIAPYTSSGGASVAVSPVLPVGGYSTPSPSVGHQSPVHPPQ